MTTPRPRHVLSLLVLLLATALAAEPISVLLVTPRGTDWGPVRRLQREEGMVFGAAAHGDLDWELVQQFNVVVLFDLQRLDAEASKSTWSHLTPRDHDRLLAVLSRYVQAGGGLYAYGVSFQHMGQGLAAESLNRGLRRFDAQSPFELLRDPPNERRQEEARKVLYARADRIAEHPVTAGVKHYWYPIGPFVYGPWVRPLVLGDGWTPLLETSPEFTSQPLGNLQGGARPLEGAKSAVTGERAVIYAVREFGQGRIALNGGESTVSFFGYDYSPYADAQWQRIGMERGFGKQPSDGWRLFANTLKWLAEPAQKAGFPGGFVPPPPPEPRPTTAEPKVWETATPVRQDTPWLPGMVAVIDPARLTEFAEAARQRGLALLVAAADFEQLDEARWQRFQEACRQASGAEFAVLPALLTRDAFANHFIQAGSRAWPRPERLSPKQPQRVRDHLGYWMNDAGFPLRIAFHFSAGNYPSWLHSGYNSFGVRTWRDGELVDEDLPGLLQAQEQGDRARVVAVHYLSTPDKLTTATELTWFHGHDPKAQLEYLGSAVFSHNVSYVSSGPRIRQWRLTRGHRQTYGQRYVPGLERWRATLAVESDAPLSRITIYRGTEVWRRFAVTGPRATIHLDGLHSTRHVLTAVIEDEAGGRAVSGTLTTSDSRMRQTFCSDRCNIMAGHSTIRTPEGEVERLPASSMLYKAGRLSSSVIGANEELPGIDGSGVGAQFSLQADLRLKATDPELGEERSLVHRIYRPWEAADGLIFRTPIERRSTAPGAHIYGHNPYVDLHEPRHTSVLTQYHFYRNPVYPSPTLAEFQLTAKAEVTTASGFQGLHARLASTYGTWKRYAIVRRDGTVQPFAEGEDRSFRGRLESGDSVYFPAAGEGFYVRRGPLDLVIECHPEKNWFRLWSGFADEQHLEPGGSLRVSLLLLRVAHTEEEGLAEWQDFGRRFGLVGQPAFTVEPTRGMIWDRRYVVTGAADRHAFEATFTGDLPQRLPLAIVGLNPKWTIGLVDRERRAWHPLAVALGAAHTTVALRDGEPRRLLIANLVTTEHPALHLTFLPANADGRVHVDVHNPTEEAVTATIRVPIATWLAAVQEHEVTVAPMSTETLKLQPQNDEAKP